MAWLSWNNEFGTMLGYMDCDYYYNIQQCDLDPTEDNYEDFCNLESTRQALHVGNLEFPNSGDVYRAMLGVFMQDGRGDLEFCLERYRSDSIIIMSLNQDIICMIDNENYITVSQ